MINSKQLWQSLWIIGLGLSSLSLSGQSEKYLDKVVLTNGSVIWGMTEMDIDGIKIFLDQGNSMTVPDSMIRSLKTQKLNPALYQERALGVYYQLSVGALIGKGHQSSVNDGSFSAIFISGYKFRPALGIGLGMAVNYYPEQLHIPLFVDIQGDLLKSKLTPYYQLSTGWSWAEEREIPSVERLDGGFYLRPAIGVRWHFTKYSWHLQVSYVRQNSTTHYEPVDFGNGQIITNVEDRVLQRAGVSVGVSF